MQEKVQTQKELDMMYPELDKNTVEKVEEEEDKIYGVKIEDLIFTVENKYTLNCEEIGTKLYQYITNDEIENKLVLYKKDSEKECREVLSTKQEIFHASSMLLMFHRDRAKKIKEFNRMKIHYSNIITSKIKKKTKNRNKKKNDKKFNK